MFQGDTLTAPGLLARATQASSERPICRIASQTAMTAGTAPAFSHAAHCRWNASQARAAGRPWVITADPSATTGSPLLSARSTSGAIVSAATHGSYVGIFIAPAGVAELVQAHGLGPCGVSHEGSSPSARTNTCVRLGKLACHRRSVG